MLEKIARGTAADSLVDALAVVEGGEDEDLEFGSALADLGEHLQAVAAGQAEVEKQHVGGRGGERQVGDQFIWMGELALTGQVRFTPDQARDLFGEDLVVL